MNDVDTETRPAVSVHLVSPPELRELSFVRSIDSQGDGKSDAPLSLSLGLNRLSRTHLGVEVSVQVSKISAFDVSASYQLVLELQVEGDRFPEDYEHEMHYAAVHVAPSILYPFIRETLWSVTAKAGLPPYLPPIMNFANVFSQESVVVPLPNTEHVEQVPITESAQDYLA